MCFRFCQSFVIIIWKPADICTQHKPHEPCCRSPYELGMHARSVSFIISHLIQCTAPSCLRKLSKRFRECKVMANRPSSCSIASPSAPFWLEGIGVLKVHKLSYIQGVQRSPWRPEPRHLSGGVRAPDTFCGKFFKQACSVPLNLLMLQALARMCVTPLQGDSIKVA